MNISATIRGIGLPRTIVIAGLTAVIAAFGIIGCASSGPPQISEQNNERCFLQASGNRYANYARNAEQAADLAERLANSGELIAAGRAAAVARQQAEQAEIARQNITDSSGNSLANYGLDPDDMRRSARACRDIADDYADYAERVAKQ